MSIKADSIIHSFPLSRLLTMDIGKLGLQKHHIKALIELDVTDSRNKFKIKRNKLGIKASFISWIIKCISMAIEEHKQVNALRKGKNKLVEFKDIDISVIVEKMVDNVLVPLPLVIRAINNKEFMDISNEIKLAKNQNIIDEKNFVLEKNKNFESIKLFLLLPQFVRLFLWRIILSNPYRIKKMMGTVMISSVGMMGNVNGWFIPYSIHPICFALGSIIKKPGVIKNRIEIREYLEMTILIDHDVVDGAPAARFVSRLKDLIENGFGL